MSESDTVDKHPRTTSQATEAHEYAASIPAVPQQESLSLELEDGQDLFLVRHRFRPLRADQMRLLRIHPWRDRLKTKTGDLPRCELRPVSLRSPPRYAAVSDTWGNVLEYNPVLIDGTGFLNVTKSLFSALCQLSSDETLDVWADQLCINQHDLIERGEQVTVMGKIFGQAFRTFVWLGDADETTEAAFSLLERLADTNLTPMTAELLCYTNQDRDNVQDVLLTHDIHLGVGDPRWRAVHELFSRRWFTRLWTVQEVIVSQDVQYLCGRFRCSMSVLIIATYIISLVLGTFEQGMGNAVATRLLREAYRSQKAFTLLDLLPGVCPTFECTDPRDYIFALLPLETELGNAHSIKVSYSKPVEALLEETAKSIILSSGDLEILQFSGLGTTRAAMASWVPDWQAAPRMTMIRHMDRPFRCCSHQHREIKDSDNKILVTRGRAVAKVIGVAKLMFNGVKFDEARNELFLNLPNVIPEIIAALQKTGSHWGGPNASRRPHPAWLLAMTLTAGNLKPEDEADFSNENAGKGVTFIETLKARGFPSLHELAACSGRGVAMLDTEVWPLGLVPKTAQEGDLVYVLHGSDVPIVLGQSGDDYQLLGTSYVHGMMYGEAVTWAEDEGNIFSIV